MTLTNGLFYWIRPTTPVAVEFTVGRYNDVPHERGAQFPNQKWWDIIGSDEMVELSEFEAIAIVRCPHGRISPEHCADCTGNEDRYP